MSEDDLEPVITTELPTGFSQLSEETLLSLSGDPAVDRQSSL